MKCFNSFPKGLRAFYAWWLVCCSVRGLGSIGCRCLTALQEHFRFFSSAFLSLLEFHGCTARTGGKSHLFCHNHCKNTKKLVSPDLHFCLERWTRIRNLTKQHRWWGDGAFFLRVFARHWTLRMSSEVKMSLEKQNRNIFHAVERKPCFTG